ncbi:MAG TPA: ribbon-helix-helix protein, CopG family [Geobacteraceae bacterium]|nr:ribbon-helix-helix protein, CopG family [Geobacteraceae bacterium]
MAKAKLAITLDEKTLAEVDGLVKRRIFPNRSRIIEAAIQEKLARLGKNRLAAECALLDPKFEKAMAEEGMGEELREWPEY